MVAMLMQMLADIGVLIFLALAGLTLGSLLAPAVAGMLPARRGAV